MTFARAQTIAAIAARRGKVALSMDNDYAARRVSLNSANAMHQALVEAGLADKIPAQTFAETQSV